MSGNGIWIAILVAAGVSLAVRALPLTMIRRPIRSRFIRSFLFYVPYATLAVMTFPSILSATQSPWSALAALVVAIVLAWCGRSLFQVAVISCVVVFLTELLQTLPIL